MPCSGADKYLDSISSIKGDDQPQTLTYFQKLVSSQVSSENWRIVYQSYQCPVFETDWKNYEKLEEKFTVFSTTGFKRMRFILKEPIVSDDTRCSKNW